MGSCGDFLDVLGPDVSFEVLKHFNDPSDYVRITCVSRSWRQFVIANGLCKRLCSQLFPEASFFNSVIEERNLKGRINIRSSSYSVEWDRLEREHRIYARLARGLTSARNTRNCIHKAISASSTDNFPEESIDNTLEPRDEVKGRPSYWSSVGKVGAAGRPETLTYKLKSQLCVVEEINIQPFEAYFQRGQPIYSAQAVRFRMGYSKYLLNKESSISNNTEESPRPDDSYIWTYTSPEFPMAQKNGLQTFKLPQPVICMGGILQIELLGGIQKQALDGLYYICICHVQVMGRPLSEFDIFIHGFPENCTLIYSPSKPFDEGNGSGWHAFMARIGRLRTFSLRAPGF
ncbi:hypothetical protein ACLOJK_006158 [Asimina triloba]